MFTRVLELLKKFRTPHTMGSLAGAGLQCFIGTDGKKTSCQLGVDFID